MRILTLVCLLFSASSHAIIGGMEAEETFLGASSTVALYDELDRVTFCTGTLINSKLVITAGHCFNHRKPHYVSILFSDEIGEVARIPLADARVHPDYLKTRRSFLSRKLKGPYNVADLAIVSLSESAPSSAQVAAVDSNAVKGKLEVITYGYGYHDEGKALRKDDIKRFGFFFLTPNFKDQLSVEGKTQNMRVCHGDSGGPSYRTSSYSGHPLLVAITSGERFGLWKVLSGTNEGCKDGQKASFVSVAKHLKWIRSTANELLSSTP